MQERTFLSIVASSPDFLSAEGSLAVDKKIPALSGILSESILGDLFSIAGRLPGSISGSFSRSVSELFVVVSDVSMLEMVVGTCGLFRGSFAYLVVTGELFWLVAVAADNFAAVGDRAPGLSASSNSETRLSLSVTYLGADGLFSTGGVDTCPPDASAGIGD